MKEATQFSHLTLRDRIQIQIGLETSKTVAEIADKIKFSRQRIYREIITNGLIKKKDSVNPLRRDCLSISHYPFVCNTCPKKTRCTMKGRYYYADHAHELASFRPSLMMGNPFIIFTRITKINCPFRKEHSVTSSTITNLKPKTCPFAAPSVERSLIALKQSYFPLTPTYFITECMMTFLKTKLLVLGTLNWIPSSVLSIVKKSFLPFTFPTLGSCLLVCFPLKRRISF